MTKLLTAEEVHQVVLDTIHTYVSEEYISDSELRRLMYNALVMVDNYWTLIQKEA